MPLNKPEWYFIFYKFWKTLIDKKLFPINTLYNIHSFFFFAMLTIKNPVAYILHMTVYKCRHTYIHTYMHENSPVVVIAQLFNKCSLITSVNTWKINFVCRKLNVQKYFCPFYIWIEQVTACLYWTSWVKHNRWQL